MQPWLIGEIHPIYGKVTAMGSLSGERYRWFIDDDGGVSMIPLDVLEKMNMTDDQQEDV